MGTVELNLLELMEQRGMRESEIAAIPGIGEDGASRIIDGKVSAIRLSLLAAICDALQCGPGDILKYVP